MKLLALCLLWILGVTVSLGAQAPVTSLKLPQDEVLPLVPRQQTIFCLPSTELEFVSFDKAFFHDLLVDIELLSTEITFPWYSVKGISKDDFEIQIEKLLHRLFKDKNEAYVEMELYQRKGFLRDILSSCPNPIFSSNKIECQMRFSPLDSACVLITPLPSESFLNIKVSLNFNYQYLIRFMIGLFLLLTAHEVSKSKLFQFLSGALLFFTFGIVITLWIIYNRFTNPRNTFSVFNNIVAVSMLLSYGATVIWYLRMNFRTLLLDYWQFSAGYALVSSLLGLVSTGVARRSSSVKHLIVVLVKWFLRLLGGLFIYQSFSSPRISLFASITLLLAYVFYAFRKSFSKRFQKKKN